MGNDLAPEPATAGMLGWPSDFGSRLEWMRRSYGKQTGRDHLPCTEFARELGLKPQAYRRYERGEVEPSLSVLVAVRRVTGVCLDWLVAGLPRGTSPLPDRTNAITLGMRLRWTREIFEPWLTSFATVMGVSAAEWNRFEQDEAPLPVELADQAAQRLCVSLDFLYRGRLTGMADRVREDLLQRHPELRTACTTEPPDNGTAKHADSMFRSESGARALPN